MKIGIVTIYKCYNYGSFYQAYGLQKYLEDLGHQAEFVPIDSKYNRHYRLRKQFSKNIKRDFFSLSLCKKYLKTWKKLNIGKKDTNDYDLIIIGSDEIWNINNKTFVADKRYYGLFLPIKNVFTYASCIGGAKLENFENHKDLIKGIKQIPVVSARDFATKEFLSKIRNDKDIPMVIDPSFLIKWDKIQKNVNEKDFILVYTYDGYWGFNEEQIKAAKDFAKEKNLPLVSVGFKNDWCDKSVAASAEEFLGYLKNASYVITDTFHGTALSIQYEKQFISFGKGKQKVESLLCELNLKDRFYDSENSPSKIAENPIDYLKENAYLSDKISFSKDYINKNIKK